MIRVLIVDDQAMVRAGFNSLLESETDIEVVGLAANGQEAIEQVKAIDPDVTLMDIRMPVLDGLAATRHLMESGARTRVLMLTTFDLDEYVFESLRAGASGFLLKDSPAEQLSDFIRVVARGDSLLAPEVTRRLIDAFVSKAAVPCNPSEGRLAQAHTPEPRCSASSPAACRTWRSPRSCSSPTTSKTHVSIILPEAAPQRPPAAGSSPECALVGPGLRPHG